MVEGIVRGSIPQMFRPDRDNRPPTVFIVAAIAAAILAIVGVVLSAIYGPPAYVVTPYYYSAPAVYYPIFF